MKLYAAVICLAVMSLSCLSLQAVSTTAAVGTRLPSLEKALDDAATLCVLGNEAPHIDSHCAQIREDAQTLRPVMEGLSAYAHALGAMANGTHNNDDPSNAMGQLQAAAQAPTSQGTNSQVTGAISLIAQTMTSMATDGLRQRNTRDVILATDASIANVGTALDALLNAQIAAARNVRSQIDDVMVLQNALKNPAARLAMLPALQFADATLASLQAVKGALGVFVKAHHTLRLNADRLDSKDLLKAIQRDMATLEEAPWSDPPKNK